MLAVANGTGGNRVTLTDVAEHAGVSAAAASLAPRGLAGVAESTLYVCRPPPSTLAIAAEPQRATS